MATDQWDHMAFGRLLRRNIKFSKFLRKLSLGAYIHIGNYLTTITLITNHGPLILLLSQRQTTMTHLNAFTVSKC